MAPDRENATRCPPEASPPRRPWQFTLLQAGIVITALCVWLGAWHLAGATWGLVTMAVSGPVVGLGLVDFGLRTRSLAAQWLGGIVLLLWPVILFLLAAILFLR